MIPGDLLYHSRALRSQHSALTEGRRSRGGVQVCPVTSTAGRWTTCDAGSPERDTRRSPGRLRPLVDVPQPREKKDYSFVLGLWQHYLSRVKRMEQKNAVFKACYKASTRTGQLRWRTVANLVANVSKSSYRSSPTYYCMSD